MLRLGLLFGLRAGLRLYLRLCLSLLSCSGLAKGTLGQKWLPEFLCFWCIDYIMVLWRIGSFEALEVDNLNVLSSTVTMPGLCDILGFGV